MATPCIFAQHTSKRDNARKIVYAGGKRRIDREEVAALIAQGVSLSEIARQLGVSRRQIYRIRDELAD